MQRHPTIDPETMGIVPKTSTTGVQLAIASAGAVVAAAVVSLAYDWGDAFLVPDFTAGFAFVLLAAWAWPRSSTTCLLALAFAAAWFAGTVIDYGIYWHRGVLIHLILALPRAWPNSVAARTAIAGGYAASATPYVWSNDAIGAVLAMAAAAVAVTTRTSLELGGRAARWSAVAFATAVAVGALARGLVPQGGAVEPAFVGYALVLTGIAAALGTALPAPDSGRLADLVVELGDRPPASLADEVARELGTSHDDPLVVRTVATVRRMTAANRALQEDVEARVEEVVASRRRILAAADEGRSGLQLRLREQVQEPLSTLERSLTGSHIIRAGDPVHALLRRALGEVAEIAAGIRPRELDMGLAPALEALSRRSPVPVELAIPSDRLPPEVETTVFYVCAEAVANAIKHAAASTVRIELRTTRTGIEVVIADDGRGGADPARGTGLRGLADRVAAHGGTTQVVSPPGGGTTLRAQLPLG